MSASRMHMSTACGRSVVSTTALIVVQDSSQPSLRRERAPDFSARHSPAFASQRGAPAFSTQRNRSDEHPFLFQSSVVPTTVTRPVTRTAPSPVLEGPHQSASCCASEPTSCFTHRSHRTIVQPRPSCVCFRACTVEHFLRVAEQHSSSLSHDAIWESGRAEQFWGKPQREQHRG